MRLGEMLINSGYITEEQLEMALKKQKETHEKLGEILLKLGFIQNENIINAFLAKQLNIGTVTLSDIELNPDTVKIIPEELARKYNIIGTMKVGKTLFVASSDPHNVQMLDSIKFALGYDIQLLLAAKAQIAQAIDKYYQDGSEMLSEIMDKVEEEEMEIVDEKKEDFSEAQLEQIIHERPLVKLVDGIIADAVMKHVSDIHIEPFQKKLRLRYRIDGNLVEMPPLPIQMRAAVVSRIKIMSKLNISQTRLPQDGRIKVAYGGRNIDIRVNVLPTVFGEKVVMRLLDPVNLKLDLRKLGFPEKGSALFRTAIRLPFGMILVVGPTGSGKTTTLYSALLELNTSDTNIMTVEDPVEFNLRGINQVSVREDVGLTFAAALRSFLRQDPDIILVGEIRDYETAEIAIKAALTGHLVFSTLHTNNAPATITRLVDLGSTPFLVASAVKLIVAQRLLKLVCPHCKVDYQPTPDELEQLGLSTQEARNIKFYHGRGCPECSGTGYRGRTAVFEVMYLTKKIQRMIIEEASAIEIQNVARTEGMLTLREEAIEKLKVGITTVEQVIAETMID
ncbi:type IV-A pilus assembly ATPase PilB [bacterium]|nr:type IV-A pilus assembly ATPase PilB [bacterium]